MTIEQRIRRAAVILSNVRRDINKQAAPDGPVREHQFKAITKIANMQIDLSDVLTHIKAAQTLNYEPTKDR